MDPLVLQAIIYVGGGLIGSIIVTQLYQLGWFKKERFKQKIKHENAEYRIRLKKLERDLKLKPSKKEDLMGDSPTSPLSSIASLAPILNKLDSDQIGDLINLATNYNEDRDLGENDGGALGFLNNLPPEAIEVFLNKLTNKTTGGSAAGSSQPAETY